MKPDRSTPRLLALFETDYRGGFFPRRMILERLQADGGQISKRTLEYALAKAVRAGILTVEKSGDGGALYALAAHAARNSQLAKSLQSEPLRSLQSKNEVRFVKALARSRKLAFRGGAHDANPGHRCPACGSKPCKGVTWGDGTAQSLAEATRLTQYGSRLKKSGEKSDSRMRET